ncbi:MAG: VIT1/CCC1 transporter family protein [Candidatus Uhrbacteria bacterium]
MNNDFKIGLGFGLTSAIITTLGLMMGLQSASGSRMILIGGILTIAVADAFSDALGIHAAKESEGNFTTWESWRAAFFTFLFKGIFACSFVLPVLIFSVDTAILVSVLWGFLTLALLSYHTAREKKQSPVKSIVEHLSVAAVVLISTHYIGKMIALYFK